MKNINMVSKVQMAIDIGDKRGKDLKISQSSKYNKALLSYGFYQ